MLYKEWCNYLEEDYFKRLYARREVGAKLARLFDHYRQFPPRPLLYLPQLMRVQLRYYYLKGRAAAGGPVYTFSSDATTSEQSSASVCHDTNNLLASLQEFVPPPLAFKKKSGIALAAKTTSARRPRARSPPHATLSDQPSLEASFRELCRMLDRPSLADCSGFSVSGPVRSSRPRVVAIPRAVLDLTAKKQIAGHYADEYQMGSSHEQTKLLALSRKESAGRRPLPPLASARPPSLNSARRRPTSGQRIWQRLCPEAESGEHRPWSSHSEASTMFRSASTQFRAVQVEAELRFPSGKSRTRIEFRPAWMQSARKKTEDDRVKQSPTSQRLLTSAGKAKRPEKMLETAASKRQKLTEFLEAKLRTQTATPLSAAKTRIKSPQAVIVHRLSASRRPSKPCLTAESPRPRKAKVPGPRTELGFAHQRSNTAFKVVPSAQKSPSREPNRRSHAALPRSDQKLTTRCRRSQSELRLQRAFRLPTDCRESVKPRVEPPDTPGGPARGSLRRRKSSCTGMELGFNKAIVPPSARTTPGTKRFQLRLPGAESRGGARRVFLTSTKNTF